MPANPAVLVGIACFKLFAQCQPDIFLTAQMPHHFATRHAVEAFAVAGKEGVAGVKRAVADGDYPAVVVVVQNVFLGGGYAPVAHVFAQIEMRPCLLGRHLAEFVQYAAHFFPAVGNGEVVAGGNYADAVYGKQFVQLDAFEPVLASLAVCLLGDEKVVGRLRDEGLPLDAVQCFVL